MAEAKKPRRTVYDVVPRPPAPAVVVDERTGEETTTHRFSIEVGDMRFRYSKRRKRKVKR